MQRLQFPAIWVRMMQSLVDLHDVEINIEEVNLPATPKHFTKQKDNVCFSFMGA